MMKEHNKYISFLKESMQTSKSYQLFHYLMQNIVTIRERTEANVAKARKELAEQTEKRNFKEFNHEFEAKRRNYEDQLNGVSATELATAEYVQAVERRVMHQKNLVYLNKLKEKLQIMETGVDYGTNPEAIIDTDKVENHSATPEELALMQQLVKSIVTDLFLYSKKKPIMHFPNEKITDLAAVAEEWWLSIDKEKQKKILVKDFTNLLIKQGVISKSFEFVRMMKTILHEDVDIDGEISLNQASKLFARVYLRSALINLLYFIKKEGVRKGDGYVPKSF